MKRSGVTLWLSVVGALGLLAPAVCAAEEQAGTEAAATTIAAEHQAAQELGKERKYAEALGHYRKIVELAAHQETLTAQDYYALAAAYLNLVAEACDKALQAGGLNEEQAKKAQQWRDHIWPPEKKAGSREKTAEVQHISHGEEVNLADYLVPGKTVVFDFFSEYCGPCKAIAPHLEKLHKSRDDIVVVKVDINRPNVQGIDWQSPVARQYKLDSIPHFKLYGPDGKLQAEGDEARTIVQGWFQ